jgi:hypothetical protein
VSLPLSKIAETAGTITLGWAPPPDAQAYVFYAEGKRVSNGSPFYLDGPRKGQARDEVKYAKGTEPYEVACLCRDAAGVFRVELGTWPVVAQAGKHVGTMRYDDYRPAQDRYADGDMFLTAEWAARQAAADLSIPVYGYSDLTMAQDAFFTGVTASEVRNRGWAALHNGQPIVNDDFGGVIVDLRKQDYRDAQVAAIVSRIRDIDRAEGVFFDDCMYDPRPICNGVIPDGFSIETWHQASLQTLAYVADGCRRAGLKVMGNCGWFSSGDERSNDGRLATLWASEMAEHMDSVLMEYGAQVPPGSLMENGYERIRGSGPEWFNNYDGFMAAIKAVEAKGADFIGLAHVPNGDSAQAIYSKASLLLHADRSTTMFVCHDEQAPWGPLLLADLGAPSGPMTKQGGVYRRTFSGGSVELQPGPRTATITAGTRMMTVTLPDTVPLAAAELKPDFSKSFKPIR